MNRYIIPLIIFAVCLLPACSEDYNEPEAAPADAIVLSVSDAGFAASDGTVSRSQDTHDGLTVFERNDMVGLIILDGAGHLLVDNVPYSYDGSKWDFYSDNTEGKERAYFDKEMKKYIVYYPYTPGADGVTSEKDLLKVDDLAWRKDQRTKDAFRHSDVMIWSDSNGPIKDIQAEMTHVRNSLSLDLKVRYALTLKDESNNPKVIDFHPKRLKGDSITSYFEDFTICVGEDNIFLQSYNAQDTHRLDSLHLEDGAYRYILPDGFVGTLSWRYYYKGKTYAGKIEMDENDKIGTRYKREELLDMGSLSGDNILQGDYYCTNYIKGQDYSGNKKENLIGYVLPQDALELLHDAICIGIVFWVGQHPDDSNDLKYPARIWKGTDTEETQTCHGYAVALTNASESATDWCYYDYKGNYMGTNTGQKFWGGYKNCQTVINDKRYQAHPNYFQAIYLCDVYGNGTSLEAPYNSSGWYLPSCAQGVAFAKLYPILATSFSNIVAKNNISDFKYIHVDLLIGFSDVKLSRYWTSTENTNVSNECYNAWYFAGDGSSSQGEKYGKLGNLGVRAILSF